VLTAQGKFDEAEPEIEMALAIAKEIGNPPQLWKTQVALGDLRNGQGHEEDAREAFGEALAAIERVAGDLDDDKLRETFLSSRHVRGIREKAGEETSSAG
jgi:hypothetical protein